MAHQGQLFAGSPRPPRYADFAELGERIWPTPLAVLERAGDILVYRHADAVKGITPAQHRLFAALARYSDPVDAPGSIQVLVATGQEGVTFDRGIAIYDHMRNQEQLRLAKPGEIPGFISAWWQGREGRVR